MAVRNVYKNIKMKYIILKYLKHNVYVSQRNINDEEYIFNNYEEAFNKMMEMNETAPFFGYYKLESYPEDTSPIIE